MMNPDHPRARTFPVALTLSVALAFLPSSVSAGGKAQKTPIEEIVTFNAQVSPEDPFDPAHERNAKGTWKPRRGQIVRVDLVGTLKDGWNTYPISQRTSEQNPKQLSTWAIDKAPGFMPLWPLRETPPKLDYIRLGKEKQSYFKLVNNFTWSQDVYVAPDAPAGQISIPVKLRLQLCSVGCEWYDHTVPVNLKISDEPPIPLSPDFAERIKAVKPEITVVPVDSPTPAAAKEGAKSRTGSSIISEGLIRDSAEQYKARIEALAAQMDRASAQGGADLLGFILAGIFWGAISLITPCVFPMIPITVSFFLKQSEKEHHRPIVMASVYSLTIVAVLTLAAAFLLSIFRELSLHPISNYFIGGLFIFFALSLFGMYEIELPNSLAKFTSSREGQGGFVGTIFMALTFTIISFACVAPFLGGFSGTAAAARPLWHNLLGGLAFSVTFASPFFFLALFPALLRKLPKSGSWLNVVKVVMGFLEFAAAFKFFRTAELIQSAGVPSLFTFDLILGLWIALCVLCGLYLIGTYRLPHDTPEEHISVPRLLFAAAFFGLALYLTPALFKVNSAGQAQRPGGFVYAWIDSFLLPESTEGDGETIHTADLHYAVTVASEELKKSGKPKRIFIDFTGVTCTNCKINEKSVFTKTQISALFEDYIVVKMYTDTVPPEYYASDVRADFVRADRPAHDAKEVNLAFQKKVFGTEQLPLYVVIEPQADGKIRIVGVYAEGRINNEMEFAEFLRHPDGR